ncbi:MAG TPA: PLDc N-terminal domain-containing protein [Steroidobacteraceae bacterium]|nr:PLDc N-terminal domain-containing protein [Steroidobacteraceae bacterium]
MASSTLTLPTMLQMLLGLYAYLLPMLLYVLWSTLALWDLGQRADAPRAFTWGWAVAIFLLPFVGAIAYLLLGAGQTSRRSRIIAVGGGAAAYVLILLLGVAVGGVS